VPPAPPPPRRTARGFRAPPTSASVRHPANGPDFGRCALRAERGGNMEGQAGRKPMHFELYKDQKHEWRWRLKADNGKTVADSGEGYKNKEDATHEIDQIKRHASAATVKHVD
jgi:uncharacterized protein YegP (UPF0339 family)